MLQGKIKVLASLVRKSHIRSTWSLVIQKYSSKKRIEFDDCEFCSILLFLPDNNLPLQSYNNLNTNRQEAFQKVMNSEASEPRRSWFKCTAPAAQRDHQLYSPAVQEEKIIFQSFPGTKKKLVSTAHRTINSSLNTKIQFECLKTERRGLK